MRYWEKLAKDKIHLLCIVLSLVVVGFIVYKGGVIDWDDFGHKTNTGSAAVTSAVLSDALIQRVAEECKIPADKVADALSDDQISTLNAIMQSIDTQDRWALTADLSGGEWRTLEEILPAAYYKQFERIYEDLKQTVSK